jgi:rhodanese-related sulfurtransferase
MVDKISLEELRERLEANPSLVLVEALPEQYYRRSHIPGAINLSHDEVYARAPDVLGDKDAEIVVYCASATCQNSAIAADRLAALGYSNVRDYHEGKAEWTDAGLPVEGEARAAA